MLEQRRKRAIRLTVTLSLLLLGGLLYAGICTHFGFGIPCVFYKVTGLSCPGCGMSRMCLALLRGDLLGAWNSHPAALCLLPLGAVVGVHLSVRYVRDGTLLPRRWANVLIGVMIVVLVAFGVIRNLPFYA